MTKSTGRNRIYPQTRKEVYTVGQKVRFLRTRKGWRQDELAKKSGLFIGTIHEIEWDDKDHYISSIGKIAKAFGLSLAQFFENVQLD